MLEQFDHLELLAFVENELDAEQEQALRQQLADRPEVLAFLLRLRGDRDLLRSIPEPALPADFISQLEPQLARPMLMERRPGEYRRRHHRQQRGRRLVPVAIAAGVVLALFVSLWAAMTLLVDSGGAADDRVASESSRRDGAPTAPGATGPIADALADATPIEPVELPAADWPPDATVIHHGLPLPPRALVDASPEAGPGASEGPQEPTMVAVDFALVVSATDVLAAEETLQRAVQTLDDGLAPPWLGSAALVRNFSFEEARAVLARLLEEPIILPREPEHMASLDGVERARAERQWRESRNRSLAEALRRARASLAEEDETALSKQLLGPSRLAASYERQLGLAERGASHTITVRAGKLTELLEAIWGMEDARSSLRPLPADDPVEAAPDHLSRREGDVDDPSQWVGDYRAVRELLAELAGRDDAYVLLPVIVQSADDESSSRRR